MTIELDLEITLRVGETVFAVLGPCQTCRLRQIQRGLVVVNGVFQGIATHTVDHITMVDAFDGEVKAVGGIAVFLHLGH